MQLTTLVGIPTSVSMFKEQEEKHHRAGKPSSTLVFINLKRELENVPHHHLVKRNKINYLWEREESMFKEGTKPQISATETMSHSNNKGGWGEVSTIHISNRWIKRKWASPGFFWGGG